MDVGAAAELGAEEQVHRVVQLGGQVDDGRVEDHDRRLDRGQARQDRAEDPGVDDRGRHRAALVDAQDDLAQAPPLAAEADPRLGDDRAVLGLVVLQVRPDRAVPVDLVVARAAVARGPVEAARSPPGAAARPVGFSS